MQGRLADGAMRRGCCIPLLLLVIGLLVTLPHTTQASAFTHSAEITHIVDDSEPCTRDTASHAQLCHLSTTCPLAVSAGLHLAVQVGDPTLPSRLDERGAEGRAIPPGFRPPDSFLRI
jgi:hypothetical protein